MSKGRLDGALDAVERVGNRLPDPVTLFIILIAVVLGVSLVAAWAGLSAINPVSGDKVAAINLFSAPMLRRLFTEMPQTFAGFPPLGTVLLAMLGVGVAEKSGLIGSGLAAFVRRAPQPLLTPALVFACVMSSLAVDAGYVVLIPLGAVLFLGAGRHPLAGIAAAFAGVSAGFSANLLITPLDALLAGLTQSAAHIIDPTYQVPITANYYLMVALVPLFVVIGTWLTDRVIEPHLGAYDGPAASSEEIDADANRRGLRWAGVAFAVFLALVLALTVGEGAPLRDQDGGLAPLFKSMVALLFLGFLAIGMAYGFGAGTIKNDRDAVRMAASSMSDMGLYIVLAFVAAHFIALFSWSNLGIIAAINGAEGLRAIGLTGIPLLVGLVLLTAFLNLFIGSASAKWALIAPIFVPMLMLIGYTPEYTQAAYRLGDSFTNVITPLMPYFPMVIVFARRYAGSFGIGSLVALMLPYSITFGLGSILLMALWLAANLALGPGSYINI